MALGVYCFNWTQSSRSLSGSYNEGAVVLPLERLIPTPITPSVMSIISSLPAIYRHCGSDYLGFDIGLICHGLGLDWSWSWFGLGLERCGLVNISGVSRSNENVSRININ